MDSTRNPPNTIFSLKSSTHKLPIKRKTPSFTPVILPPPPSPSPSTPPFKFHRIWTEPDEIRFLQGLLDSAALSFPKDLNLFYDRFSTTMSQPYTKSQLSEKLRRLRNKFRLVSARLEKGVMDRALLSPHDRALYDLSEKLWHPDYSKTSPFGAKVSYSTSSISPVINNDDFVFDYDFDNCDDLKLSEVNVEFAAEEEPGGLQEEEEEEEEEKKVSKMYRDQQIGGIVGKSVVDVFDKCLNEAKMGMKVVKEEGEKRRRTSFEERWREVRFAEMEVLARRLRLVVDDSLQRQSV